VFRVERATKRALPLCVTSGLHWCDFTVLSVRDVTSFLDVTNPLVLHIFPLQKDRQKKANHPTPFFLFSHFTPFSISLTMAATDAQAGLAHFKEILGWDWEAHSVVSGVNM
jgi:hypothetical protein